MSANSKNSDKKWSYHLWLPEPPPPAKFSKEHLPPETIVGTDAIQLIDCVCQDCNGKFSVEDKYFATHYHGAIGRIVGGIVGKKGRGAELGRADLFGKYQQKLNTILLHVKKAAKKTIS